MQNPCLECPKPCRQFRELMEKDPLNQNEMQRIYKICQEKKRAQCN